MVCPDEHQALYVGSEANSHSSSWFDKDAWRGPRKLPSSQDWVGISGALHEMAIEIDGRDASAGGLVLSNGAVLEFDNGGEESAGAALVARHAAGCPRHLGFL